MHVGEEDPAPGEYSPTEWNEIALSTSLANLATDQVILLYRHWLWAEYSRQVYEDELAVWMENALSVEDLSYMGRDVWALFVWSGLLFVVIEGMTQRRVRFGGNLVSDIRQIRDRMNDARNATFHVGRDDYAWDERLSHLWEQPDPEAAERVHWALGRLLRVELSRRPLDAPWWAALGLDDADY